MTTRKIAIAVSLLLVAFAGCDDNEDTAASQGGGPGSSDPGTVIASGNGFCQPGGGDQALGQASFDSGVVTANIDFDGDPALSKAQDPDYQPGTSGTVNGQPVNSSIYNYVVMSPQQMRDSGVNLGDWATVTSNGQTVFARVEDRGPIGGLGEVSAATADALGIKHNYLATYGNPQLEVRAYAGTAAIQGDCAAQNTANNS